MVTKELWYEANLVAENMSFFEIVPCGCGRIGFGKTLVGYEMRMPPRSNPLWQER